MSAQHQLRGIVKDAADGSPVPFATVTLLHPDSSVVTGVITVEDGKFIIEKVLTGDYIIQVSFIGYEKEYRNVNVTAQSDIGEIMLIENTTMLNEVIVKGSRPLLIMKADRYIVNVSGNIQSAGRDAYDILRNTPGLLVDQNGNVSLMGNSVQVWIDGRPLRMSGEQLRAFLNSMQGGEIDRIEVITNPSSRYEAEGSGGIIDIRTRKGLELGINGTLTAGYRQGRMDRENAGVNLNWRREKYNVYGNYSVNRDNYWERIAIINVLQTPEGEITFDQIGSTNHSKARLNHNVRAGMDYFINSQNIIGMIVNTYYTDAGITNLIGRTDISPTYNGVNHSKAENTVSGDRNGIQVNMNYQSKFANPGQQLNFDLDFARFNSKPLMENTNRYYNPDDAMIDDIERLRNTNPQKIDVYSAKIDYVQSLWKDSRMETGVKFNQNTTDNDLKYDVFNSNVWQPDPSKSNRFIYTEQVSAAYINVSQRLDKFNLQVGLRGEHTYSNGKQKTTGEVNDTTYFNLFPTFFVNYQAQKHNFGLSYSRRLSRPNFDALNPFEIILDAYTFRIGNPYLTPAYTHNVQLSHMIGTLMSRVGYSSTTDLIMQLTPVKDAATQRTGLMPVNFGRNQNISMMVNYRKQISKIWTANLMVSGAYLINTSNEFVNKGNMFYVQQSNNITITPTLSAEITGLYRSRARQAYFVMQPVGNFSIGLRQMLLKNKMTLSLTINDILLTSTERVRAEYETVDYSMVIKQDSRYINLTLRYNFGSTTVKAARNKSTGIEDEASRAGGR